MIKDSLNKRNITPVVGRVSLAAREKQNGHRAAVVWLTGLSASGKTTIAIELEERLFEKGIKVFILDGDNLRSGLSADLGFSIKAREENIRRAGEVAKLFCEAGIIVLAAFISPRRQMRRWVRGIMPPGKFIEVFVDCPLAECEWRDPKGLYRRARKGEIKDFTGITALYQKPLRPEIYLNTQKLSLDSCVNKIARYLKAKKFTR